VLTKCGFNGNNFKSCLAVSGETVRNRRRDEAPEGGLIIEFKGSIYAYDDPSSSGTFYEFCYHSVNRRISGLFGI